MTEKLHYARFCKSFRRSIILTAFPTHTRGYRTACLNRRVAMREKLETAIPDTAPYKEWLGIVGAMALAVLICTILFAGAIPT